MKRFLIVILALSPLFTYAQDKINWMTWEEAIAANEKNPKKIFVDVYTDWCKWCKKMDKTTFKNSNVVEDINKYYYAIKLDAELKTDITINDKTYGPKQVGGHGFHELAEYVLDGKMSFPSYAFLDENFKLIESTSGYKEPKAMVLRAQFYGTNTHKKASWDEFYHTK
jgi:thioredoxin-related protein